MLFILKGNGSRMELVKVVCEEIPKSGSMTGMVQCVGTWTPVIARPKEDTPHAVDVSVTGKTFAAARENMYRAAIRRMKELGG